MHAGRRPKVFATSVTLAGLRPYTRYHFRIIATNCGGCRTGTTHGADHTFTTAAPAPQPPPPAPQPLLPAPLPAAPLGSTGPATTITQISATVTGTVAANGLPTTWHFEYGPTSAYVSETPPQSDAPGMTNVSASLTGLADAQTYHYRLVATNSLGTSYGADQTFTTQTPTSTQQEDADHAIAAYAAMQQYFYAPNVYPGDTSSLYAEDYPQSEGGNRYSYLWPFSRALVGTITLAGIPPSVDGGLDYQADVNDRLTGLSHYWDGAASPPGYDSYVTAPFGGGGDKYYDDQAWVGLALAQDYRLTRFRRWPGRWGRVARDGTRARRWARSTWSCVRGWSNPNPLPAGPRTCRLGQIRRSCRPSRPGTRTRRRSPRRSGRWRSG